MTLYHQLAATITEQIAENIFKPGDKLPSTRALARKHQLSINTVIEAQKLLESQGIIQAKPRSGYYVRQPIATECPAPAEQFEPAPKLFQNQALVLKLVQSISDPKLIHLGTTLPDPSYFPIESLNKCASRSIRYGNNQLAHYSFPPGSGELRELLSRRMGLIGCKTSKDNLVVTNGCHEALLLALRSLTSPGDIVALESPTYYGLLQIIDTLRLKVLEIPTSADAGIDAQALDKACQQWPVKACVLVTNFSNPLGASPTLVQKQNLLDTLIRHQVPLIEDDIYGDLAFDGHRPEPIKSLDKTGNVLYCSSFAKSLSPGLRIGWIEPGRFTAKVNYMKFAQSLSCSAIDQAVVSDFLSSGQYDKHIRKLQRKLMLAVKTCRTNILAHFPDGTRVSNPKGGFVLWVELPKTCDSLRLHQLALAEHISFAPGQLFSTSSKYSNYMRISCAHKLDDKLIRAFETLGKLAKQCMDD